LGGEKGKKVFPVDPVKKLLSEGRLKGRSKRLLASEADRKIVAIETASGQEE